MANAKVEMQLLSLSTKLGELSKEPGTDGVRLELRAIQKQLKAIEAKMSGRGLVHDDIKISFVLGGGVLTVVPPGPDQEPNFPKRRALSNACRSAGVDYKYLGRELDNKDPNKSRFQVSAQEASVKAVENVLADFYPGASLVDDEGKVTRTLPTPPPAATD